jgi:hypothetical protein
MTEIFYTPYPASDGGNRYLNETVKAIESIPSVTVFPVPIGKRKKLNFFFSNVTSRKDCVVLNWHENLLRKKDKLSISCVFSFFVYLLYYRLVFRRVVYVRHNMYPHGMKGYSAKLAGILVNLAERFCTLKVAHSGHLCSRGYKYVPHPLYQPASLSERNSSYSNNYFLIFGRVERYKKIESIISEWGNRHQLLIAGSSKDKAYVEELRQLSQEKNIKILSEFIQESAARNLVANAKAVILAHDGDDMIVSGSFFYAISMGTPVYSVKTDFLNWVKNENRFDGVLTFNSSKDIVQYVNESKYDFLSPLLEVRENAEKLFGERAVFISWNKIFSEINM